MRDLVWLSNSVSVTPEVRVETASDNRSASPSRREAIARLAFFGSVMALLQARADARAGSPGSNNIAAVALPEQQPARSSPDELEKAVKIARAMQAGPPEVTREAEVVEMDHRGNINSVLRKGSNGWLCMPGNENRVGDPPMCVDELGMQWFKDVFAGRPEPTNRAPGLCYMLCGATQHSNDTPFDHTSPAIPIGPHWMILWPFDAKHCGLPMNVRDAGAWIMFAGTPYAYLHICGTPWDGNEYTPGDEARWTMQYSRPRT
jgi:hypothetical protein